MTGQYMQVYIV